MSLSMQSLQLTPGEFETLLVFRNNDPGRVDRQNLAVHLASLLLAIDPRSFRRSVSWGPPCVAHRAGE